MNRVGRLGRHRAKSLFGRVEADTKTVIGARLQAGQLGAEDPAVGHRETARRARPASPGVASPSFAYQIGRFDGVLFVADPLDRSSSSSDLAARSERGGRLEGRLRRRTTDALDRDRVANVREQRMSVRATRRRAKRSEGNPRRVRSNIGMSFSRGVRKRCGGFPISSRLTCALQPGGGVPCGINRRWGTPWRIAARRDSAGFRPDGMSRSRSANRAATGCRSGVLSARE